MRRLAPGTPIGSMATNRGGEMASTSNDSTVAIWCIDDYIKRYQQASVGDWWISEVFAFDHPQFGIIKFFLRFMPKNGCEASDAFIDMQVINPPVKSSISIKCKAWIETHDKRRYETLGVNRPVQINSERKFWRSLLPAREKSKLIRSQTIFVCLRSQYPVKTAGAISYPNSLHCWSIPVLAPFNHVFLNGLPDGISHYETLSRLEEFIVEGPFNIYCNICPITAVVAPTREPIFDQRFASFFNNPFFSDAEIHVDNKIFKISRAIVSGSSPIFRAMFDKKIKEQTSGVVRIDRFEVAMVEKMLIYIYENKVDNLNDIAAELLPVADYYQIDNLVKICVDSIVNNLTTKNVLSVLQLAFDRPHLIEFRVYVMNFTNANYNEIRQLDGFEEFFDAQPEIANQ
ncbi:Protein roadkill [Aphelenchoides besseyi]|nr:Protein roadkill [Aphelenchoides besseyi]